MKHLHLTLLTLAAAASLTACPCGCVRPSVDTLSERALETGNTWSVDLRHDSIDQNERDDGAALHHFLAEHRYDTLTIETQLGGATWSLALPRIERLVYNIMAQTTQSYSGLGDASLTARFGWQGMTVTAGIKLPTGESDRTLAISRRYLQLGTGSTDIILALRKDFGAKDSLLTGFAQIGGQSAVASDDAFRPGATLGATLGVRLRVHAEVAIGAQVSATRQFRDRNTMGAVDPAYAMDLESSTLGTTLTPGVVWTPNAKTHVYAHISEPLSTKNYALTSGGGTINPVHASTVVSIGLTRQF